MEGSYLIADSKDNSTCDPSYLFVLCGFSLQKRERGSYWYLKDAAAASALGWKKRTLWGGKTFSYIHPRKFHICWTIARVENWQTKAAPFNSQTSPIDIFAWTLLPMGDVGLLRQKMGFRLFVCLFAALYDMYHLIDGTCIWISICTTCAKIGRHRRHDFHPELVWVCPRNLVSFSWLRDAFFFKKNQISGTRGRYSSKRDSIASIPLFLNQFRLEMDIKCWQFGNTLQFSDSKQNLIEY